VETARQLTLIDQELLHSIRTGELLAYVREHSSAKKSEHYQGALKASPDLDSKISAAIVHRGTLFYRWVHTEVLLENTVDSRAQKVEVCLFWSCWILAVVVWVGGLFVCFFLGGFLTTICHL
jgi:RasGEF domain